MSEVAVAAMTEQAAQRLTERIRLTAHNYAEARQKLQELVAEAKSGNAHLALGYASWTAYLEDVLGAEPLRLAKTERPEMVGLLSGESLPVPVIAAIVGVSERTVQRDIREGVTNVAPSEEIHGRDGKTYPRTPVLPPSSEPQQPKRAPLPEQYFNAVYDLGRVIERIQKLTTDDRFNRNKVELSGKHASDLDRHHHTLTTLISELNN